ncbi:MAG: D-alanine--D-alanine ligase A, partial [Syntrophales bacterium]
MQQTLLKAEGLNVPDSIVIRARDWQENKEDVKKRITKHFAFPVFTKPTREGSSVGVTGVKDEDSL